MPPLRTRTAALHVGLATDGKDNGAGNPMYASDHFPDCADALYQTSGTGTAQNIPAGAKHIELTAIGGAAWFKLGSAGLTTIAAPSASTTGGSPSYIGQGGSIMIFVGDMTKYGVVCAGAYSLRWWV